MVDTDYIINEFIAFDLPIPYKVYGGNIINIKPFTLKQRHMFNSVQMLFTPDKRDNENTKNKLELDFFIEDVLMKYDLFMQILILMAQIGYEYPFFGKINDQYIMGTYINIEEDKDKEPILKIDNNSFINNENWEDIKKIIMYQNDINYDDSFYFDATIRKNIAIEQKIRSKGTVAPNLERQFNMITSHCGIPKSELLNYTLRGFDSLFKEVCDEAEFFASYGLRAKYAEKGKPAEHWVWKTKKNGLEGFATEASGFLSGLGMDASDILEEAYKEDEPEAFKNEVSESEIEELRRKIAAGEM